MLKKRVAGWQAMEISVATDFVILWELARPIRPLRCVQHRLRWGDVRTISGRV